MNSNRKVRFKLAWSTYRVGDVIEPGGTLRDWLLACGYVELVRELVKEPATRTMVRPRIARAMAR